MSAELLSFVHELVKFSKVGSEPVKSIMPASPANSQGEQIVCFRHLISMGGRSKNRQHPHRGNAPAVTNGTGGGQPDPPTRLFALQKDVLAVAFGTALRAYDLRCDASSVVLGATPFLNCHLGRQGSEEHCS
jgi:hypothetical protein